MKGCEGKESDTSFAPRLQTQILKTWSGDSFPNMKQYTNGPQAKEVQVNFSAVRWYENDSYPVKIVLWIFNFDIFLD